MTVSLILGLALAAGAPEPVVWTKMADPDPNYVAPKDDKPKRRPAKASGRQSSEPQALETAAINLVAAVRHAKEVQRGYEREARRLEEMAERTASAAELPDEADAPHS